MKHSFSRRKKIFLSVTAGVVLVVFLAGAAGAAYISGKMDLLSRPSAGQGGSSQSGTDPGDAVLSFDGMDLSGIDVMENGGSIAPPEGGVNINSGVINVLLIGSDERENSAGVLVYNRQEVEHFLIGMGGEQIWSSGTARLDGPTALVYARMRKLDSDWERVERQREVVQAAADQVATLSLPKLDLIANKLLPRIETNLTNGELWQHLFKMPVLLGKQAQQMTVPEREETWSISSGLQSSLIGCDFAAEADRLDRFLRGESSGEGADHVSAAARLHKK